MLSTVINAFVLGLLSSLHCVGMCGPLLLALPLQRGSAFLYHTGRILTYSFGGLLFGLLGRHIYLAEWQQTLSIVLGLIILFSFIIRRLPITQLRLVFPQKILRRAITHLWQSPSTPTFFLLGMANGLLPCGMVYLALAAALTRPSTAEATLFMTVFGIGTLPLLIATQWFGYRIAPSLRPRLRRTLPVVTVLVALLLILRGLNLGIPYVSPRLAAAPGQTITCH